MAVHASHAALPYPIKNARYSMLVPYLDADGDPTAPTTPDTEFSLDNAAAGDTAEEVSATSGMDGMALMTFTGAETNGSILAANYKVASGPKATLATLYPRVLAIVGSGTLSAGSAGGGTLGTLLAYDVTGCFIRTTGGTGGGGTGGANNQARKIITYNTSTGAFTVAPDWETTPSTDTTYDVLLPDGVTLGMLRALNPTTPGSTLTVTSGVALANLTQINSTSVAGTGTRIADAFVTMFNIAVPVFTVASVNQTGDSYAIVNSGTHGNAALKTLIDAVQTTVDASPTVAVLVDAIWDELIAGHLGVGSVGEALSNASSAGDPWSTALPGAYGAGTAGKIIGDNITATIGSRATQASVDTLTTRFGVPADLSSGATLANNTADIFSFQSLKASQASVDVIDGIVDSLLVGVNISQLGGSTQSATDLKDFADEGYNPATNDIIFNQSQLLSALGLATGNLDTQFSNIWNAALTESYKAVGAQGTAAQLMYEILHNLTRMNFADLTKTIFNLAGTPAKTYTLDDAEDPLEIVEAT